MDIKIINGDIKYLEQCYEILINSEIGQVYFKDKNLRKILSSGIEKGNIDVALISSGECVGFAWCEPLGAFQRHPYLHVIAVKDTLRGKGIGKKLMKHYEEEMCKEDNKVFLMVADFNVKAKKLYEDLGYEHIGVLADFYKEGVNEYLMVKKLF